MEQASLGELSLPADSGQSADARELLELRLRALLKDLEKAAELHGRCACLDSSAPSS